MRPAEERAARRQGGQGVNEGNWTRDGQCEISFFVAWQRKSVKRHFGQSEKDLRSRHVLLCSKSLSSSFSRAPSSHRNKGIFLLPSCVSPALLSRDKRPWTYTRARESRISPAVTASPDTTSGKRGDRIPETECSLSRTLIQFLCRSAVSSALSSRL